MPACSSALPDHLEEQSLLGVHRLGLARGDSEEVGVETGDVGRKPPHFDVVDPGQKGRGRRMRPHPSGRRHLGDRVAAVDPELPIALRSSDIAGKRQPIPTTAIGSAIVRRDRLVELVHQGAALRRSCRNSTEGGAHGRRSQRRGLIRRVEQRVQYSLGGSGWHIIVGRLNAAQAVSPDAPRAGDRRVDPQHRRRQLDPDEAARPLVGPTSPVIEFRPSSANGGPESSSASDTRSSLARMARNPSSSSRRRSSAGDVRPGTCRLRGFGRALSAPEATTRNHRPPVRRVGVDVLPRGEGLLGRDRPRPSRSSS